MNTLHQEMLGTYIISEWEEWMKEWINDISSYVSWFECVWGGHDAHIISLYPHL